MTSAANTAASPKSKTQVRKFDAPLHAATRTATAAQTRRRRFVPKRHSAEPHRAVLGGAPWRCGPASRGRRPTRLEAASRAGGAFGYNGASPGPILRGAGRRADDCDARQSTRRADLALRACPAVSPGWTRPAVAPGERATSPSRRPSPASTSTAPSAPRRTAGRRAVRRDRRRRGDAAAGRPRRRRGVLRRRTPTRQRRRRAAEAAAPPGARIRLRLANAAPDLILTLRASDAAAAIVAIDGQRLRAVRAARRRVSDLCRARGSN